MKSILHLFRDFLLLLLYFSCVFSIFIRYVLVVLDHGMGSGEGYFQGKKALG